jgi:hypothetical protein
MIDYGQFCTVARGAGCSASSDTAGVRELLCGSHRFNDPPRPAAVGALLTQRLQARALAWSNAASRTS